MSEQYVQHPETPVIIIERDDEQPASPVITGGRERLQWWLAVAVAAGLLMAALAAYIYWKHYTNLGIPVSTSPSENISKLKAPYQAEAAEIVLTSDSILGVALDFYAIHGVQADIELNEPDTSDTSVMLYTRCADFTGAGKYIGSFVTKGQELQNDLSRLGYMGMANGQMVIGVSRSDKVKDYVQEQGGSFFRQFILVSDGVIPVRFYLHGKVERRAIGRMDDTLYYIATRHKETLWDFADALREYGFIDAIYLTGGDTYSFYRTRDGQRHDIGNRKEYPHKKWKGVTPWLVFRQHTNNP